MKSKNSLDIILKLLEEEARGIKNKKNKSPIAALVLRRPLSAIFMADAMISVNESDKDDLLDLKNQANSSKNINEFLRNIITDYDVRYQNRKSAEPLVKDIEISHIEGLKPEQKVEEETVRDWYEVIEGGKRPFIIVRTDDKIDGHHKLEAYKRLGILTVPVLFEKDLIDFYNKIRADKSSLNEGVGQKPITKKFNHLKWPLNQFQKQFLDDFIDIPDNSLNESDFEYASKRTGIPVVSIKSIRNTYVENKTSEQAHADTKKISIELGLGGGSLSDHVIQDANSEFEGARDLTKDKSGKVWSMNPNPEFRKKSLSQLKYEYRFSKEGVVGGLTRKFERELPVYMFEWIMYFLEGSEKIKLKESKIVDDLYSNKFDKPKFIIFSVDNLIKGSGSHPYDMGSQVKIKDIQEIESRLKEFNGTFNTNFIVSNQYTGEDGFLKVVLENAQTTDGKNIYKRECIDMSDNDIKKAITLGFYDEFTTTRSIT